MKTEDNIFISLVIPTRGMFRLELLKKCLTSFFSKAKWTNFVEALIVMDLDDMDYRREVEAYLLENQYNVKIITRRRDLKNFNRDYVNYATQCSQGSLIWGLNDDTEVETSGYDSIIHDAIQQYMKTTKYRNFYILTDDSTHTTEDRNIIHEKGCCFPIISRFAAEKINGLVPKEINLWGADIALFEIFKGVPNSIIDLSKHVKLAHHSHHNGSREKDETSETGYRHTLKSSLTDEENMSYIRPLWSN
jgi:hypothetical protein